MDNENELIWEVMIKQPKDYTWRELTDKLNNMFNTSSTDMPFVDDLLSDDIYAQKKGYVTEVMRIFPDQYIILSAKNRGILSDKEMLGVDDNIVRKYAQRMLDIVRYDEGDTFPMLYIGPDGNQEGRHRALAFDRVLAMILKKHDSFAIYKERIKIPVAVVKRLYYK